MKRILIFGSNSFLANQFILKSKFRSEYTFCKVGRSGEINYHLDFIDNDSINNFKLGEEKYDVVLFFQGKNPSLNLKDSSFEHFQEMFAINISGPSQILKNIITKNFKKGGCVIFFGSLAAKKGSYDPAYAAAKSALKGMVHSLSKAYSDYRFNIISLGLVQNSTVYQGMTTDFARKHAEKMFDNKLIDPLNVVNMIDLVISNNNIANTQIDIDGGYLI